MNKKIDIPTTMKAVAIHRFGPPSVMTLYTLPVPEIADDEVLISVHAAGVGTWDAAIRDGTLAVATLKPRFPLVLGADGAGIVVARGRKVRRVDVGNRAWAYTWGNANGTGGFYAEYVAVSSEHVGKPPPTLPVVQAGAGAVTGLTAQQGIELCDVRREQVVLIFGASGAVGTLAVQLADHRGAHVIATATGRDAQRLVKRLGAHVVIDARDPRELDALHEQTFDAILALAGGPALERCIDALRPDGRVVHPNGVEPPPRKRRGVEIIAYDAEASPARFDKLARAAVAARLRVPIAAELALPQAAKAHQRLEHGHVLGRIVLRVRRGPARV